MSDAEDYGGRLDLLAQSRVPDQEVLLLIARILVAILEKLEAKE